MLIPIIHSPVHRKVHRPAGLPAWHKEPGKRGRRNESSYEMRGMFDLKTKAGERLLFFRSVSQLACFYPSVLKVRQEVSRVRRRVEGRQAKADSIQKKGR